MKKIPKEDWPLKFDFDIWSNSYEVRNNKGLLIEALENDYAAVKYLTDVIGMSKEEAKRVVECTFLAGLSR